MFDLYMGDFGGTSILGNLHIYIYINTYLKVSRFLLILAVLEGLLFAVFAC